jgi:sortase A
MNFATPRPWLQRMELVLLLLGSMCAVFCVVISFGAGFAQRASERFIAARGEAGPGVSLNENDSRNGAAAATVMGRLEIPELALSVPILSDYETASLLEGVGHIPGTAMPGGLGTLGLAGHRDTYFRPLAKIKPKMDIRVVDRDGIYHYSVDSTEIVKPEEVRVLDIRSRPELALVTCYPFHYVGAAPLRFIVHARLMSASPEPAR